MRKFSQIFILLYSLPFRFAALPMAPEMQLVIDEEFAADDEEQDDAVITLAARRNVESWLIWPRLESIWIRQR
jgi:hypothetical protein